MKAISLWQPWASLIACGVKVHETRHWHAPGWLIGQRIAIHAAKKLIADPGEDLAELLSDEFGGHWVMDLPRGAIVATATLANCCPTMERLCLTSREDAICGDWHPGRFAWHLTEIRKVDPPQPYRGAQGIWEWSPEQAREAMRVGA